MEQGNNHIYEYIAIFILGGIVTYSIIHNSNDYKELISDSVKYKCYDEVISSFNSGNNKNKYMDKIFIDPYNYCYKSLNPKKLNDSDTMLDCIEKYISANYDQGIHGCINSRLYY